MSARTYLEPHTIFFFHNFQFLKLKNSVYCMGMFSLCDFVKSCSVKLNLNSNKRDSDGVISLVINS